jgi:hypothetical protein
VVLKEVNALPLVFVHGVNVRSGSVYDKEVAFRNHHFTEIFYSQLNRKIHPDAIFNPYWGDLGAKLSPELPFLPRGVYQSLWQKRHADESNPTNKKDSDADNIELESETPLLDIARTSSTADVVDVLWELAERDMLESGNESQFTEMRITKLAQRALAYAETKEGKTWLAGLTSDEQLVERLTELLHSEPTEIGRSTVLPNSLSHILKSAGKKIQNRIHDSRLRLGSRATSARTRLEENVSNARFLMREKMVSTTARLLNEPLRAIFHEQCALLIGDAFAYFSNRGDSLTPSPIAQRVIDALSQAAEMSAKTGEELIVIGHSMGGVILCDIVTCYGKHIPIDVLITVGSQFPLFADLGMFPGVNDCSLPLAKPEKVRRWMNIFDPHDFLGYPASQIFSDVDDYHLPTYAVGASAHVNYFNRRGFYFHLARRMVDYLPSSRVSTTP